VTRLSRVRLWVLLPAVVCIAPLAGQQQPTFRATADVVSVDVTVFDGGAAVRGLTTADFALTDNGVAQRIQVVEGAAMPVDVTVIVDLSRGTGGAVTTRLRASELRAQIRENVEHIRSTLRATDRLQVLASEEYVTQLLPMQPVSDARLDTLVDPPSALGRASTYDALAATMLREGEPGRRHLVVAWIKPVDTASIADAATIREIAQRTDVVVHVVERDLARRLPDSGAPRPPSVADLAVTDLDGGTYLFRTWRPHAWVEPALLTELPTIAGGTYHGTGALRDRAVADEFRTIFDAFRQGYVLQYRPEGIPREGAHTIVVTVARHPNAEIRARRGYTIDPARSVPPNPRRASPPVALSTVGDLVDLFERTDDRSFQASVRLAPGLRQLLRDYRDGPAVLPAHPRLEAILALQLAAAGTFAGSADSRDEATALLTRQHDFVRDPIEPTSFECAWYRAANAVLQASYQAKLAIGAADRAIARCPASAALALARAVSVDQLWSLANARSSAAVDTTEQLGVDEVMSAYDRVIQDDPSGAVEARVRASYAAYRARQFDRALTLLAGLPPSSGDRSLDYYHHLIRAHVLRRVTRPADAARAYQAALAAWPDAQSARVGLMTLLVEHGPRAAAEALSEAIQAAPADQVDPWWVYWQGDYRGFSAQIQELRAMAHRPETVE
jgi:VWFA-related protein